ncbi:MAG: MerR family DNA-binding transcriptional regulator [Bdellovibrionia bacterium]
MDIYKPGQFAKRIGRTVSTLHKWDYAGRLKAHRTSTGRRFYTEEDFRIVLGLEIAIGDRVSYSYCRVSSAGQKAISSRKKRLFKIFVLRLAWLSKSI